MYMYVMIAMTFPRTKSTEQHSGANICGMKIKLNKNLYGFDKGVRNLVFCECTL